MSLNENPCSLVAVAVRELRQDGQLGVGSEREQRTTQLVQTTQLSAVLANAPDNLPDFPVSNMSMSVLPITHP